MPVTKTDLDSPLRPKVFCIGFHKTGTTSMGAALQELGYAVVGPFGVNDPDIRRNALPQALEIARRCDAVQDNPWPVLYRELDSHFPGSRFVLTVRNPRRWIASVVRHFGEESTPMREWIYGAGSPRGNEYTYLERFVRHEREVREYFAGRDQDLLIMNLEAGDGWLPLSSFLGLNPPDRPFPHRNKGGSADLPSAAEPGSPQSA